MDNKGKIIGGIALLLLGIGLMLEVTHVIDFNFEGFEFDVGFVFCPERHDR